LLEIIRRLFDIAIHLDRYVVEIVHNYGLWTYLILFLVIFSETGFVVTPFSRVIRCFLPWGRWPQSEI